MNISFRKFLDALENLVDEIPFEVFNGVKLCKNVIISFDICFIDYIYISRRKNYYSMVQKIKKSKN
jgi:hypothetical protein